MLQNRCGSIVVVEEDRNAALFTLETLDQLRIKNPVHVVSNGIELLEFLDGRGAFEDRTFFPYPALIMVDLSMRDFCGFKAFTLLRMNPLHSRVRLIGMSSRTEWRDEQFALELGADTFLPKPINAFNFNWAVRTLHLNLQFDLGTLSRRRAPNSQCNAAQSN